jgi:adenosylcobinamide-GDP ribazoletransferase
MRLSPARLVPALQRSASLFTIVPVRAGAVELGPGDGIAALLWLPAVGAVVGAAAGLPATAIRQWAPHANALGAVLAIAALAVATRCLHLDGLADTADGLGSRAEAERALEIMRKSDIGPFGVVTLVFVLLADVIAVSGVPGGPWSPVAALAIAALTGRVAAVQAAMRGVKAARTSGFGTLVADGVAPGAVAAWTLGALAAGAVIAALAGLAIIWVVGCQAVAMGASWLLRAHAQRRLGGMTGDVFGALIETGTAVALIAIALW